MARRSFLFLLALAAVPTLGASQSPAPRKKVVLALSGGGAYGLMYLGALEWLERHRVPVDAIAGTSGGALVGGWYATGLEMLSDEEVLHPVEPKGMADLRLRDVVPVISRVDFEHLFDSQPDYRNLNPLQKEERQAYPTDLFSGFSDRRTLRRDGLVPGQTVNFFLDYIGRDYPDAFDSLPTPFRAVTTDAPDGDPVHWRSVVLGGRNPSLSLGLSRAIRASIAVPFLFAPERAQGRRLIDGAMRDNLPTDAAIDAFDPDVLIALRWDSGFGPDPYRAGRGGREPREKAIVTFDPRPYNVGDFARWRELAWIGYQGMEARRETLERYALSPDAYLAYRHARKAKPRPHTVVRVTGDASGSGLDDVRRATVGKSLDDFDVLKDLGRALDRIVADEGLATAGYDFHPDGTLSVRTTRHAGGPPFFRSTLSLQSNSGDRLWYGVQARVSDLRPRRVSYWFDGMAGNEPSISGGLDVPIMHGLSLTATAGARREIEFDFRGDDRASEVAIATSEARVGLAYRPRRSAEFSLGGFVGANGADDLHGTPLDPQTGGYRGLFARATLDTTDEAVVPHEGTRTWLEGRGYDGLDRPLFQGSGSVETFLGTRQDTLGLRVEFGTSFGGDAPFPFEFRPRLDAYRRDEIRDDGFVALGATQSHLLAPLPLSLGRLYLQTRLEAAFAEGRSYPGASIGVLGNTRVGTGYFGFGLAEHGAVRFLIGLGRRF